MSLYPDFIVLHAMDGRILPSLIFSHTGNTQPLYIPRTRASEGKKIVEADVLQEEAQESQKADPSDITVSASLCTEEGGQVEVRTALQHCKDTRPPIFGTCSYIVATMKLHVHCTLNGQCDIKHGTCIWHLALHKHSLGLTPLIAARVPQAVTLLGCQDLLFAKCPIHQKTQVAVSSLLSFIWAVNGSNSDRVQRHSDRHWLGYFPTQILPHNNHQQLILRNSYITTHAYLKSKHQTTMNFRSLHSNYIECQHHCWKLLIMVQVLKL